jgi:precorrin-6A/cobalt-precorrin-6A reductase
VAVTAHKLLILGGTRHARALAEQLAGDARYDALLSFAGRTASLQRPAVPHRVGGFGGADGLAAFLRDGAFRALIDATHAFAARISNNAVLAAAGARVPLLRVEQPAWSRQAGDLWHEVADMAAAAALLRDRSPARVLLTIGRLEADAFAIAPQHRYLIRAVDAFSTALPDARLLLARGPFELAGERALLEREAIDLLVSKNAGTAATSAKLEAARALGVPVIMVQRPALLPAETVTSTSNALAWLARVHRASGAPRGA